jgi:hypothetical protein
MQEVQTKRIERRGGETVPYVHRYPEVRGGVCEWCGILNDKRPSIEQYRLCSHFNKMGDLACSYCPMERDPNEVIRSHTLNIYDSPYNPGEVVVVCDDYDCVRKHRARFKVSS